MELFKREHKQKVEPGTNINGWEMFPVVFKSHLGGFKLGLGWPKTHFGLLRYTNLLAPACQINNALNFVPFAPTDRSKCGINV